MTDTAPQSVEEAPAPVDTPTEKFDDAGNCVLVLWPMAEYPSPAVSITAGKTREQIVEWINGDPIRAEAVLREESDKFDDADRDVLWDCMTTIDPTVVRPQEA